MPGANTTEPIKDGGGTTRSMRWWDESGTGVGPFSFQTVISQNLHGTTNLVLAVGKTTLFPVTLSLDTSIYASGDVLADTQVLTSLFRISDGTGVLQSIEIIDQDDQKQAIDFYYLSANNSLGTENSTPSISDANAIEIVGPFSVAAADYKDLGGVSVAKIANIGQPIIAASGTSNGYIAAVCNSGTPTYTASGIKLRLGVLLD